MTATLNRHLVLLPILLPLAGSAIVLLLYRFQRLQAGLSMALMAASFGSSVALLSRVAATSRPVTFALGAWDAPFGIVMVADLLSATLTVMCQLVFCLGMLYALGCRDRSVRYPAFYPMFLALASALTGTMLSGDVFNLFVFAELLVVAGTGLTASADDRLGVEAAYKYFYISTLAGLLLLVACGCLYVSYGTLNMADLARRIASAPRALLGPPAMVLLFGFFMVKSAVVPFHFWQPDFHAAAPTPVSAMLSSVVVKLGVYGMMRMTTLLFVGDAAVLRLSLVILGIAGIVFGGLGAIGTCHLKRMLAYSTLGQIGFILVAIGWGTPLALAAALVFAFNHSLMKSALLMLAGAVASRSPAKSAAFDSIRGLGRAMPAAGALFLVGGVALAGIPPTNGFISKLLLFRSGIEGPFPVALAVMAGSSVLTFLYVLRAFQKVWWEDPREADAVKPYGDRLLAPAMLIVLCLALGIAGEPLVRHAQKTAAWLGDPSGYIEAVLHPGAAASVDRPASAGERGEVP